jgi:hypothetical protein
MQSLRRTHAAAVLMLTLACVFCLAGPSRAVDEENCLFCHGYRGLSYITSEGKGVTTGQEGEFRLLYVTEDLYLNSPHGNLKCSDCHAGIEKFPHGEVKKVDCLIVCHMNEPSSGLPFSHQRVADHLGRSAHSRLDKDGTPKEHQDDYPDCITCHQDPLYRPLAFLKENMPGLEEKTIQRCSVCHEENAFMLKFFSHFTSRMQKLRKPKEVVEMCGTCHGDTLMMERHGLSNLLKSYMETYHGKALAFGDERTADCTDCHVLPGQSIHDIKSMDDPASASYHENIYKTCSDIDCHPQSEMNLAGYKAHVVLTPQKNPIEFYVACFFVLLTLGSFIPLMIFTVLDMARNVFPNAVLPVGLLRKRRIRHEKD